MSEDLKIIAEDIIDFLNGLEASTVKLRMQIEKLIGPSKHSWDPNAITWQQTEGSSGPYERSEDINNLQFKEMLKDLARHQGKLSRDGFFYWTFKNGAVVGRKKRKGK